MSEPGGKWVPEGGWEKVGDWTDDYDEHPDLGVDDSDEPTRPGVERGQELLNRDFLPGHGGAEA